MKITPEQITNIVTCALAGVSAYQVWRAKERLNVVEKVAVALDGRVSKTERACFYPACGHIDGQDIGEKL